MLDREDDAALAEIEADLRRNDPAFVLLIERLEHDPLGMPGSTRISEGPNTTDDADPAELPAPGRPPAQTARSGDQEPSRRSDDPIDQHRGPGSGPSPRGKALTSWPSVALGARVGRSRGAGLRQWLPLLLGITAALTLTVVVAALAGPDVGGLVGVVSVTAATFLGYRQMAGCPVRTTRS